MMKQITALNLHIPKQGKLVGTILVGEEYTVIKQKTKITLG
jgi:hypothetical protein